MRIGSRELWSYPLEEEMLDKESTRIPRRDATLYLEQQKPKE
jgi:hypothetical protein